MPIRRRTVSKSAPRLNSPRFVNLKTLDLYNNQITTEGMKALLQSKNLSSLEMLILVRNKIDLGKKADEIAKNQSLPSLRRLELE